MSVMQYPDLTKLSIANESDVKTYLNWLAKNHLTYHLDDRLDDVLWNEGIGKPPTDADLEEMKRLDVEMWRVTDPWLLFEKDRELWRAYSGQEG